MTAKASMPPLTAAVGDFEVSLRTILHEDLQLKSLYEHRITLENQRRGCSVQLTIEAIPFSKSRNFSKYGCIGESKVTCRTTFLAYRLLVSPSPCVIMLQYEYVNQCVVRSAESYSVFSAAAGR